jgi:activator of 2-hydroxyglutaryl-CoA dehydratase
MIAMGCDIGSLFAKAAVLEDDRLRAARIVRTTGNIGREIDALLDATLADAALTRRDLDLLVGAGAGADLVPGAAFCENETTCLAAACVTSCPTCGCSSTSAGSRSPRCCWTTKARSPR